MIFTYSFADRDMLMRYHWGLGISHTYSHGNGLQYSTNLNPSITSDLENEDNHLEDSDCQINGRSTTDNAAVEQDDQLDDLKYDTDKESGSEEEWESVEEEEEEEEFLELHDMYHADYWNWLLLHRNVVLVQQNLDVAPSTILELNNDWYIVVCLGETRW